MSTRVVLSGLTLCAAAAAAALGILWAHPGPAPRNDGSSDSCRLPDGAIVASEPLPDEAPSRKAARALFRHSADGTEAMRITFGDQDDRSPRLLADGRILFERRFVEAPASRPSVWMTIHPDGTQIALYHDGTRPAPPAPDGAAPNLTSLVRSDRSTGTLLCLNAYLSRLAAVSSLPSGAIRKVRVSRAGAGADAGPALTEAAVETDGSFFVEVPADTPLRLTLLDASGRALASLDSGIWVRPNENRGCVGCHEPSDLAPENLRPLALAKRNGHAD